MYEGRQPLTARLAGHVDTLPADAVPCVNCHRATRAGDDVPTFGATLTGGALSRLQGRRGGPASRYDASALCKLLRTGVDPAWIMIDNAMPRYDIDDAACEQLWRHIEAS